MRTILRSLCGAVCLSVLAVGPAAAGQATWPTGGQNLGNTRNQAAETSISPKTVGTLAPRFTVDTTPAGGGDVSATPAVDGDRVYFPDSAGNLWAVSRSTGATIWRTRIADATGIAGDYARATPALAGRVLVIGDQAGKFETPTTDPAIRGAYVLGYDKLTGALLWKTRVHRHFAAIVTQSAQIVGTTAYVGVASNEEAYANKVFSGGMPYTCCSFPGKLLALDVATGAIRWSTYLIPGPIDADERATSGYSGSPVWGGTPAVDADKGAVYVATGNNYSLPADRIACVQAAGTFEEKQACLPGDWFDAIIAVDMKTGAIRWGYRALASDAWNTDCGLPGFSDGGTNDPSNCPTDAGPDYDFGQGPMLFSARIGGKSVDLVGAGEKSGDFSAVDRRTGALVWKTHVGPGGLTGGLQWGSATDGKRIYVAESNSANLNAPGWWSALDPATGQELWRTYDQATPIGDQPCAFFPGCTFAALGAGFGYSAQGPVSVANDVVYACSLGWLGTNMVAMNATTGAVLWRYASGSSCLGGAAIADGTVYWGTGYRSFYPLTTAGHSLFAFTPTKA